MFLNYFFGKQRVKVFIVVLVLAAVLVPHAALAQKTTGFSLVPCGGTGQDSCQFIDLIILIVRIINFLLAASVVVAMYYTLLSGWGMMSSLGNPEKLQGAKDGLTRALTGFAIVLLSFAMVNLLVLGIFGLENRKTAETCKWWESPTILWSNDSTCLLPASGSSP